MLTANSGLVKQATGEVPPHRGKTSENRTTGAWHRRLNAIVLRRTLSRRASGFQEDQSPAILPSNRGGWAAYLGNIDQLIKVFGGKEGFEKAVHELQDAIYEEPA